MLRLDEPLRRTLGDKTAQKLAKGLELHTVGDLLRHYPRRYAQRGELTDLTALVDGEDVTVLAEVAQITSRGMRNRKGKLLEVVVTDGRGRLTLTFFNQPWRERELLPGRRGLFSGKISSFRRQRQLAHPEYQLLPADTDGATHPPGTVDGADPADASLAREFAEELIPVYPASTKVKMTSWNIAKCVRIALDSLEDVADPLPAPLRAEQRLIPLKNAYELIHRPSDMNEVGRARRRLKWDEAFVLQTVLAQRRQEAQTLPARPRPPVGGELLDAFDARLPFELTAGQREVGGVIAADLGSTHPMHRLLQGDVGSGKTLVALRAMLQVVDAGGQAVLLAPTEVLAQQHHRSITVMLGELARGGQIDGADNATRVALLTGSQGAAARREALLEAASGSAGIVVGTHALLEEHVGFADLGLVVVDEQHRFGVEQRDALREKAAHGRPHVLVMTATPIPRTVAMTVYGDLDVVSLTELPAGRSPVATHVVPVLEKPHYLERAWARVREEVAQGRQVYVVCPRIGETDAGGGEDGESAGSASPADPANSANPAESPAGESGADAEDQPRPPLAVTDVAAELSEGPLAGLRVAVLHGRLAADDKERAMRGFAAGETDVLVATTVIEVGVDVPNATLMAIMDADRFGVSQLHQLRGRVGRGQLPGLCLLVTEAPEGAPAASRLSAVAATTDGFELARVDLEQRREGDVLGEAQSGRRSSLRMLTLLRDEDLIRDARTRAVALIEDDPELAAHPLLAAAVAELVSEDRAEYLEKT